MIRANLRTYPISRATGSPRKASVGLRRLARRRHDPNHTARITAERGKGYSPSVPGHRSGARQQFALCADPPRIAGLLKVQAPAMCLPGTRKANATRRQLPRLSIRDFLKFSGLVVLGSGLGEGQPRDSVRCPVDSFLVRCVRIGDRAIAQGAKRSWKPKVADWTTLCFTGVL